MVKRFVIALVLLVLVCGGLVGFNVFRNSAIQKYFANMPVQPVPVSTITVSPTSWTPDIGAIGTVSAVHGVDLALETTGIVRAINFTANDSVKDGALLLQLDDAMQRADLVAAQAQAKHDKTSLQRAQTLERRSAGTEVQVEAARAAADVSAAQVQKAQAAIDQKQLKAPFAGVIGIPRVEIGEYVTPGTVVATLQDLTVMRADFTVPEQALGSLEIGQAVRLGLTEDNMPFTGNIQGIDSKIDPVSRLVRVRAKVATPDGKLTPGQFVEIRVELPKEDNIVVLPQTAVVTSLYGDHVFVVRPAEKKAGDAKGGAASGQDQAQNQAQKQAGKKAAPALVVKQVFVKTGRRSGKLVEIRDGLSAGDRVVTAGQNRLDNGTPVVVSNGDSGGDPGTSASAGAGAQ